MTLYFSGFNFKKKNATDFSPNFHRKILLIWGRKILIILTKITNTHKYQVALNASISIPMFYLTKIYQLKIAL